MLVFNRTYVTYEKFLLSIAIVVLNLILWHFVRVDITKHVIAAYARDDHQVLGISFLFAVLLT